MGAPWVNTCSVGNPARGVTAAALRAASTSYTLHAWTQVPRVLCCYRTLDCVGCDTTSGLLQH